jgi:glutathione S-transferase
MFPSAPSPAVLFGAAYSVYTRIVRLALEEKGLPYRLVETDIFAADVAQRHATLHPFRRIPVLELDGFRLYEAGAITRFLDDLHPEPPLQPRDPRRRARMNQAIGILDAYAFRPLVLDIYVQRVARKQPDEARIAAALPTARTCLGALENLTEGDWLAGPAFTLADCHAAPMLAYFVLAPEGRAMLADHARLAAWWERMRGRPSVSATRYPREAA